MSDFRSQGSTSKSRASNIKSPSSHQLLDAKTYKKKYQKKMEELQREKQRAFELQKMIEEMQQKLDRQEKELEKKEQIEDVLLSQINQLKQQMQTAKSNKTLSKENSIEEKRSMGLNHNNSKRSHESSGHGSSLHTQSIEPKVNGYNFTLSDMMLQNQNNQDSLTYQFDYSQSSNKSGSGSTSFKNQFSSNNNSEDNSKKAIGGYFGSVFNV